MFLVPDEPNVVDAYVVQFFELYKEQILGLHTQQWNEENVHGESCTQYVIQQYYHALYLVILVYLEVREGVQGDWAYYVDKYCLIDLSRRLACSGIDLDAVLNIFGLPLEVDTGTDGIERLEVESTFEVEPIEVDIVNYNNSVDICELLENKVVCFNLLAS